MFDKLWDSVVSRLLGKLVLLKKGLVSLRSAGWRKSYQKTRYYLQQNKDLFSLRSIEGDYEKWLAINKNPKKKILREMKKLKIRPRISIVMPVYNVDPKWLRLAIGSAQNQFYQEWELCIVDDASTRADTIDYLKSICDSRIKTKFLNTNKGISGASNEAIRMATGDYIAFLDHDDEITEDALFEVVVSINKTDPDLIYSDEDKIDRNGKRRNPFFKPDWSPDLLRCQNYICHFTVIRKKLIESIGGFREGFEGAQDHDLFLRASENTDRIHHIPKVLYGWREIETSTAGNPLSKPNAQESALRSVNEHVKRVFGSDAYAKSSEHLFVFDVIYPNRNRSLVSIIIPTRDKIDYLDPCIQSIFKKTSYPNYEIIILDNNSEEETSRNWFEEISRKHSNILVIDAFYPFCWSKLNNRGMDAARGDVFIFLNNDTRVISPDWIDRLSGQALRKDVGMVGPLLLYEDGSIQHAGVVAGLGGWADHIYQLMHPVHFGSPFVSPMVERNVLAVTGSCMVVSRKTIEKIGKFDENFLVCGSDVEICIRAFENGLLNIYDPFVKLYHYESKTRVPKDIPQCDFEMSNKHYKHYRMKGGDPFFNINLSLAGNIPKIDLGPRCQAERDA